MLPTKVCGRSIHPSLHDVWVRSAIIQTENFYIRPLKFHSEISLPVSFAASGNMRGLLRPHHFFPLRNFIAKFLSPAIRCKREYAGVVEARKSVPWRPRLESGIWHPLSHCIELFNNLTISILDFLPPRFIRWSQQPIIRAPHIGEQCKFFNAFMTLQAEMI